MILGTIGFLKSMANFNWKGKRVERSLNTNLVLKIIVLPKNGEYEQMGNRMSPELNLNEMMKPLLGNVYDILMMVVWYAVFPTIGL
jgi:hypothetical protein